MRFILYNAAITMHEDVIPNYEKLGFKFKEHDYDGMREFDYSNGIPQIDLHTMDDLSSMAEIVGENMVVDTKNQTITFYNDWIEQ